MNSQMIANRYVLVQLIGEGGMASVYLAVDTILKREVAIKILRGDLAKDPVSLMRFQREANATTKLSHPNIVEVYDVGEDDGKNYIVMEYVKGKSLKELVQQRGALSKEEACNIMKQLVSAISIAHKNGIIHRDVKSQNVLVKDDGTVKLSDFGIALAADTVQLTQTDVVMGSVHYMAPELARGESASQQSDIYSLGIVFYEMVTGDVPYHADAPVQVALKHMREELPSVRDFNGTLPQSIENIIMRATAKNKANRYQTAEDMYDDLITCLDVSRAKEQKIVFDDAENTTRVASVIEETKEKKVKNAMFYVFTIGGILAIVGIVCGLIMMLNGGLGFIGGKMIPVPDVTRLPVDQAVQILEEAGFSVSSNYEYEITEDIDKNLVAYTSPAALLEARKGSTVSLTISEGKYYVMENFVGGTIEEVQRALGDYNIRIDIEYVVDKEKDPGLVLSQTVEEGTKIHPTQLSSITFQVTKLPEIYISSNYKGMNVNDVKKLLEEEGATVKLSAMDVPQVEVDGVCDVDKEVDDPSKPIYQDPNAPDDQKVIIGYEQMKVTVQEPCKKKVDDPNVKKNVVVKCSVEFGEYYTQTKKSKLTIYYYK